MTDIILRGMTIEDANAALRAVSWLDHRPDQKDAIISVPRLVGETDFYVKRTRSAIVARRLKQT